jgi:3-hydroxybutyryl-CoA dehydrogenase
MNIREVGVVGLGTMGAGIAEVFARAGLRVTAVEADPGALSRGISVLHDSLRRAVARGKMTGDEYAEIAGRVSPEPAMSSMAQVDLVIEVVPEQLAVKRQVIGELDRVLRPEAIIATNTSSLSVTAIAAASARPDRVIGMHFFNPAPVMRLVEVVTTVMTGAGTASAVTALAERIGKTPVQVADRAGFVANALLLPYLNHAARMLETRHASHDDIDLAVTRGIGLPMGPLALLDLIGLDTSLTILEILDREFGGTRYTPAPVLRRLVDAGRTGRKTGTGFYDYASQQGPAQPRPDLSRAPRAVTLIDPAGTASGNRGGDERPGWPAGPRSERADELAILIAAAGINVTRNPSAAADLAIVAIGPEGGVLGPAIAAGRSADAIGVHLPAFGPAPGGPAPGGPVGGGPGWSSAPASARSTRSPGTGSAAALAELAPSPLTSPAAVAAARALIGRLGMRAVCSADRPGLIVSALLCAHLRDAVTMVADGYATPSDVDAAMTLGCGYPRGPMRLLADAGAASVAGVLSAMHSGYGDPAFAPPPLLRDNALSGVPVAAGDNT